MEKVSKRAAPRSSSTGFKSITLIICVALVYCALVLASQEISITVKNSTLTSNLTTSSPREHQPIQMPSNITIQKSINVNLKTNNKKENGGDTLKKLSARSVSSVKLASEISKSNSNLMGENGALIDWGDLEAAPGEHGKYMMVKKKPKKKKYKKIKMEVFEPKYKYKKIKMKIPVKKMKKKKVKGYMVKKHHEHY